MRALDFLRVFAILAFLAAAATAPSQAQVYVGFVDVPPPAIPVYVQPPAPLPNYLWTPGYWGWGSAGYYWVPGTWVAPPTVGYLWTPGYWGWGGTGYRWWPGYWGSHVGYYGGINYGAGYWGNGFYGGVWHGGTFSYNTAVWNVNRTYVHNTYVDNTVVRQYSNTNRTSYNGGRGGTNAHPTPEQQADRKEARHSMTPEQQRHDAAASHDRNQYSSVNHGAPPHVASSHPMTAPPRGATEPNKADRQAAAPHEMSARPPMESHGGGRPPAI